MLVISCFVFNLWTMLFNHSSDQLPKDVILRIFSFISFHLIRRTISLLCRKWNRISEDPSIVRKVPIENFESIRLHESLTFTQLKNVVESYLGSHSRHQTKTNTVCSQASLYRIGFIGFRWDFTVQTPVILLKNIFEFMFNTARSTLYRQRWRKLQGKGFNNIFSTALLVCSTWPSGNESRPGAPKVPSSKSPRTTFSLRFFAFFFQLLQFCYVSLYSLRFLDL